MTQKQKKPKTLQQRTTADLKKLLAQLRKRLDKADKRYKKVLDLAEGVPGEVEDALNQYTAACGDGGIASADSMADFSEALALASSDLDEALEQLEELEPQRDALIEDVDAVKAELEERTHV